LQAHSFVTFLFIKILFWDFSLSVKFISRLDY
jgi:hypothetical protein